MLVKIVGRQGGGTVVEWNTVQEDGQVVYQRAILPSQRVAGRVGEQVAVDDAEQGIPYGEPWEDLLCAFDVSERTAFRIANELRRMGIWTVMDLHHRPQDGLAAFQHGYGMDVQRLRVAAQARHREAENG